MNANKAQEYFSLYFEGELEGGLREQFERSLRQDAQVQAEYKAFVQTMQVLEAMKEPVPDPSFDLTEAISRRIDKHFYESDRKPATSIWTMWRKVAVGAIAIVAVLGAAASIWNANNGPAQAGTISVPGSDSPKSAPTKKQSFDSSKVNLERVAETWTFTATADQAQSLQFKSTDSANDKVVELGINDDLTSELFVSGSEATLIEIQSSVVQNSLWIAIPGSEMRTLTATGKGTISDFAKAVCARRNVPVVVLSKSKGEAIDWTFTEESTIADLRTAVEKFGYAVEEKENGVIWIL